MDSYVKPTNSCVRGEDKYYRRCKMLLRLVHSCDFYRNDIYGLTHNRTTTHKEPAFGDEFESQTMLTRILVLDR